MLRCVALWVPLRLHAAPEEREMSGGDDDTKGKNPLALAKKKKKKLSRKENVVFHLASPVLMVVFTLITFLVQNLVPGPPELSLHGAHHCARGSFVESFFSEARKISGPD